MAANQTNSLLKLNQFAKDINIKAKDIVTLLEGKGIAAKTQKPLEPSEFEILLEALTKENQISNIEDYLDGITYIPSKKKSSKAEAPEVAPKAEEKETKAQVEPAVKDAAEKTEKKAEPEGSVEIKKPDETKKVEEAKPIKETKRVEEAKPVERAEKKEEPQKTEVPTVTAKPTDAQKGDHANTRLSPQMLRRVIMRTPTDPIRADLATIRAQVRKTTDSAVETVSSSRGVSAPWAERDSLLPARTDPLREASRRILREAFRRIDLPRVTETRTSRSPVLRVGTEELLAEVSSRTRTREFRMLPERNSSPSPSSALRPRETPSREALPVSSIPEREWWIFPNMMKDLIISYPTA